MRQDLKLELDGQKVSDAEEFHSEFAQAFGFPDFYGRNMDAWIDCMSCLDDPVGNISSVNVEPGSTITIKITNHSYLKEIAPQLWADLLNCTEFVNERFINAASETRLALEIAD